MTTAVPQDGAVDTNDETQTVQLYGGPLDGTHPGGRSLYAPGTDGRWAWVRDLRWDEL